MIRAFKKRIDDERGIAIITAMLVSMVVVTLGATSVSIAVHNSEQSSFDRRRVQGIAAAEAGIDYFFSHIQSEAPEDLECSATRTLSTTPATSFTATATYFDAAGNELSCSALGSTTPVNAHIESRGTTPANTTPTRTMEAYVRLVPITGGPFGDTVIFANNSFNFPANIHVRGGEASNNSVYTNGNASLSSSSIVYGSVYAQGTITLSGNAQVRRDAWANSRVTMGNNASVLGDAISSTSSITVNNRATIFGDARAGTSISAGSSAIKGQRIPNSPQGAPPVRTFPEFTFDPNAWTARGYTVQTFTGSSACTNAKNFARNNITSGNYVIRIAADCTLSWNKDAPTVYGNLAFISDGGMTVSTNTRFNASGGPWDVHFMFGIDNDGQPCNISFSSNSGVGANLTTLLYTPCTISMASNTSIAQGQIFGGTVTLSSNFNITYKPVTVPGFGADGFNEDILYIREIVTE